MPYERPGFSDEEKEEVRVQRVVERLAGLSANDMWPRPCSCTHCTLYRARKKAEDA